jgi:hypothetical protein
MARLASREAVRWVIALFDRTILDGCVQLLACAVPWLAEKLRSFSIHPNQPLKLALRCCLLAWQLLSFRQFDAAL